MKAIEGELRDLPLPRVLRRIAASEGSGILTVQGEDDIVAVSLLHGQVVAADALNQTLEEGLGEELAGQVSGEDLAAAVRDHTAGSGSSLGELLAERGLLDRDEYLEALRRQICRLMLQVLTWRQGEFKFYGGDEVSFEEGLRPIPPAELLVRAIEELGDRVRLPGPVPPLDAVYRPRPPGAEVRILGPDGDGSEAGIWLTPGERDFHARIDGEASAAAVARELELDEPRAKMALYSLVHQGLIASGGAAEAPSALKLEPAGHPASGPGSAPGSGALRAEIFLPPEPGEAAPGDETETAPAAREALWSRTLEPWAGVVLGLLLLLSITLTLVLRPAAVLLPFPWQENQRALCERQLRHSLFLKIDRAAKIFFLLRSHYPDSLSDLVELGLISSEDLRDPAGYALSYATDEVGYRIELIDRRAVADDGTPQVVAGLGQNESITGDFLLDRQWLQAASEEQAPLVLLD